MIELRITEEQAIAVYMELKRGGLRSPGGLIDAVMQKIAVELDNNDQVRNMVSDCSSEADKADRKFQESLERINRPPERP